MRDVYLSITITHTRFPPFVNLTVNKCDELVHDERIELRGGDSFADLRKVLLIYKTVHLHLYYEFSDEERSMMKVYDIRPITAELNVRFPNQSRRTIRPSSDLYAFERKLRMLLYVDYGELFKEDELIAVMASDFHGDVFSLLVPLALSGNFIMVSADREWVYGRSDPKCVCILGGDYCPQSEEYFIGTQNKRKRNALTKARRESLKETCWTLDMDALHAVRLMNSIIQFTIQVTDRNGFRTCFALVGNHDSEFPIVESLDILLLLRTTERVYLIQHGLFNVQFYFDPALNSNPFDDELLHIIYDRAKMEPFRMSDGLSIDGIRYRSIRTAIRSITSDYIRSKYDRFINSLGYKNINTFMKRLREAKLEQMGIMTLYQTNPYFDSTQIDRFIKSFLSSISVTGDSAFLVLGHSHGYLNFLFSDRYTRFTTRMFEPFKEDIVETDTIFKNVLTLDSGCNSLMNKHIKTEIDKEFKGGYRSKWTLLPLLVILIIVLIISIILIIRKRTSTSTSTKVPSIR